MGEIENVKVVWADCAAGKRFWFFRAADNQLIHDFVDVKNLVREMREGQVYQLNLFSYVRILKIRKADNAFLADKGEVYSVSHNLEH